MTESSRGRVLVAIWPACVGSLAVLYAALGAGAWTRRSAIAWMMGSWAARLTVQSLYTRTAGLPPLGSRLQSPLSALFFSVPALLAARNPAPVLSPLEIAAAAIWFVGFAGETTADRQFLRFASKAEHADLPCRSGLWRIVPRAHALFETVIWTAFGLFALASPWGWIAMVCPAAMACLEFARRPTAFGQMM